MVKRFVDNNLSFYTYAYDYKIWVNCPKCDELALIWREKQVEYYATKCVCTKCLFRVSHVNKNLFVYQNQWQTKDNLKGYEDECEVLIDQNCPCKEGKFRFYQTFSNKSKIPNLITLTCNFCQQEKHFDTKNDEVRIKKIEPFQWDKDPFLNYQLYLCELTKLGKIFVFNPEQLAVLKSYVIANLRENTFRQHGYFFRLPKWIKSAKNRVLVLKAIGKLEQKILANSI